MSLARRILLLAICAAPLAGCSQSYSDSTRPAVDDMRQVIQAYNSARPADLTGTAAACTKAHDDLRDRSKALVSGSKPPAQYRVEAASLASAYRSAEDGFAACARAARTLDFPRMTAALNEITRANAAINRARSLDR